MTNRRHCGSWHAARIESGLTHPRLARLCRRPKQKTAGIPLPAATAGPPRAERPDLDPGSAHRETSASLPRQAAGPWHPASEPRCCRDFDVLSELHFSPRADLSAVDVDRGVVAQLFVLVGDRNLHALGDRKCDACIPVGILQGGVEVLAGF